MAQNIGRHNLFAASLLATRPGAGGRRSDEGERRDETIVVALGRPGQLNLESVQYSRQR